MFAYCEALIAYLCESNRHIRDMAALARISRDFSDKPVAAVNRMAREFIANNPHQAALFVKKGWL